tara:strand:+ start:369 stop:569 length:201 start_codon:yes stop_codon:yes gene_type:complete
MNNEQMKKQLAVMKEMLADMRQEREEATAKYSESSEFMRQLDEDISLAMLTIRSYQTLTNQQKENK